MYDTDNYEIANPYVGELLQLSDEERMNYLSENWSLLHKYMDEIDGLLLHAQRGQKLSDVVSINVLRRLLREANIQGIDFAIKEHFKRIEYFRNILQKFINVKTLDEKREIIRQEQELISSTGLYVMQMMVNQNVRESLGSGNSMTVLQKMSQHMILLIKCSEFGIELPFAEIKSGNHDYWFAS